MFNQYEQKTTRFKLAALLALILVVFCLYYFYGRKEDKALNEKTNISTSTSDTLYNQDDAPKVNSDENVINDVVFRCDGGKKIHAVFMKNNTVSINLSDGRDFTLLQGMSASGARYVNRDESFVFWNKGDTAFVQEQGEDTFKGCVIK